MLESIVSVLPSDCLCLGGPGFSKRIVTDTAGTVRLVSETFCNLLIVDVIYLFVN